jgi:hypothetical protein
MYNNVFYQKQYRFGEVPSILNATCVAATTDQFIQTIRHVFGGLQR